MQWLLWRILSLLGADGSLLATDGSTRPEDARRGAVLMAWRVALGVPSPLVLWLGTPCTGGGVTFLLRFI